MIQYQPLSSSDVSQMRELLHVFADAFDDHASYQSAVPNDAYLSARLNDKNFIALVAHDGEVVVGGLTAYVLEKFEQARKEIYIYDLAVSESHRRQGIATGLIRELQRMAKDLGAYVIYVQADQGDEPAIKLYESLGIKEDVFHFDIPVQ